MNVRELIDALAAFGDHVPVEIVVYRGENETTYPVEAVTTHHRDGEVTATMEIDA